MRRSDTGRMVEGKRFVWSKSSQGKCLAADCIVEEISYSVICKKKKNIIIILIFLNFYRMYFKRL